MAEHQPPEKTTFIIVRHAEKSAVGSNPSLTAQGVARADKLASILSTLKLDKVYSTVYNRTKETANPTAQSQGLSTTIYEALDHEGVVKEVFDSLTTGYVLIVGHSNTVPSFLNELTNTQDYKDLDESEYDNLFIVRGKSKGDAEVYAKKF